MIIQPKFRKFICTTAHPLGCAAHIREQIDFVKQQKPLSGPKNVLVIGASTGYGLASRIVAAFAAQAKTIGVFYERPASGKRTATAGWYNSAAFEQATLKAGLYAKSINGDAFSDQVKQQVIDLIRADLNTIDLVIYSLASPRRKDPLTAKTYTSVLKPIGKVYNGKTVDFHTGEVSTIAIEPANESEINETVKVMGGEDWLLWLSALKDAGVLAPNCLTTAYSYIGPQITHDIYRDGTIGKAKEHMEASVKQINRLIEDIGGRAYVSVNKALVTQSSAAIPVVPLYISLLYKVMKAKMIHEGCIEQIYRLFSDNLSADSINTDDQGRIRIDDWEMREDVQQEVLELWHKTDSNNIEQISDLDGFRQDFFKLFGFGLDGVDYQESVDPLIDIRSIE